MIKFLIFPNNEKHPQRTHKKVSMMWKKGEKKRETETESETEKERKSKSVKRIQAEK